mgnify:CR=1 FL=1
MQPAAAALLALIPLRLLNAWLAGVADCDETYNYWEAVCVLAAPHPVRRPLQTWEYAPEFALRSWAYVLPYAAFTKFMGDGAFLAVRLCCIALPFALAEASLVSGAHARFGSDTAWVLLGLLASSAGHAAAAPALVPSATICALAAEAQGRWLQGNRRGAVFIAVLATLWPGWPFVGVLFVPLAVDVVVKDGLREALLLGVASGLVIGLPCALFDAKAYGRATSPLWNVITYNAVGGGDELYGVAPWTYYAKNLGLNAGIALVLVLTLPITLFLQHVLARDPRRTASTVLTHAAPFVLWVGILLLRPHKEERFLFPAFPSLYVGAAASLDAGASALGALGAKFVTPRTTRRIITYVALGAAALLGAFRVAALAVYYDHGQMTAWRAAAATAARLGPEVTVCAGSEWHRFPGTLLLPSNARLSFVRSSFDGQLPRPYAYDADPLSITARDVRGFNGHNGGEDNEYVDAAACDVAVDLRLDEGDPPLWVNDTRTWTQIHASPFLDSSRTPALARAFLVPGYSLQRAKFGEYVVHIPAEHFVRIY